MTISADATFESFYRDRYHEVLRLATLLVRDHGHASDITQDAFAQAFRRWTRVETFDRPDLWLRRVVINRSISMRRRTRTEVGAMTRVGHGNDEQVDQPQLDVGAWSLVRRLPRRQAQAMALVYGCDLSLGEAASVMSCSTGSVKTHLSRGRATLAEQLEGGS